MFFLYLDFSCEAHCYHSTSRMETIQLLMENVAKPTIVFNLYWSYNQTKSWQFWDRGIQLPLLWTTIGKICNTYIWVFKICIGLNLQYSKMGGKIGVIILDQTCNTHFWVGKYALVFIVVWISNGILHMKVLHFGIRFSIILALSVNYQNMQYSHIGF
jgi:hypothetical protein